MGITGTAFQFLLDAKNRDRTIGRYAAADVLNKVIKNCRVYARMSPEQKGLLVKELQEVTGEMIGMCGDGANDCNALKVADVGISLAQTEASLAAPFTSSVADITSVVKLLKIGRASLDLSYMLFKYILVYSSMEFASVITLYYQTTNISDSQLVFIDLIWVAPVTLFLCSLEEKDRLSPYFPTNSLLSKSIILSTVGQMILQVIGIVAIFLTLDSQNFFKPVEKNGENKVESEETTTVLTFMLPLYIWMGLVFKASAMFIKPVFECRFSRLVFFTCKSN